MVFNIIWILSSQKQKLLLLLLYKKKMMFLKVGFARFGRIGFEVWW